jgi:glycosyltransferase involved in cell wall biosynthesis
VRVAIDIQNLLRPKTGIGYYVYELARALSELDVDDEYLLFYFSRKHAADLPFLNETVRELRVRSLRIRLLGILWKWLPFPKIDAFLPEVDVYHFPNFFMRPHRRGRRVITIHDLSYIRCPQFVEKRNLEFLTRKVREAVDGVDRVITISEFTRSEVIDVYGLDASMVVAIPLGVMPVFDTKPSSELIARVKREHALPERYVLFIGTIEPRKNLIGLVEAFSLLRASSPEFRDLKLVICGMPGWLYDDTLKRMEQPDVRDHIVRTGYMRSEELPVLYALAGAVAMPSWYEGFGFPALEGMACGTPVVCSEKTAISEVTGDAAILVDPGDHESIADGLRKALADSGLRDELVEKGLERSRQFTWERAARETRDVYRSVL